MEEEEEEEEEEEKEEETDCCHDTDRCLATRSSPGFFFFLTAKNYKWHQSLFKNW